MKELRLNVFIFKYSGAVGLITVTADVFESPHGSSFHADLIVAFGSWVAEQLNIVDHICVLDSRQEDAWACQELFERDMSI